MSAKRRIAEKALAPIVAAGAGAAANYVAKNGPGFVEDTVLPRLKEAVQGAGGAVEKLPEKARDAVSGGGELTEQLTEKARGVVGGGSGKSVGGDDGEGALSTDELSQRREQRAKSRAKRRKATKK